MMSEVMVCFTCCITEQPQPAKRRRPNIDRSMIGLPTDFRHTGHIGSGEMSNGTQLNSIQKQMSSKGGYEYVSPVQVDLKVVEVQNQRES
ncbi:CDC42 small effector protein 2-like [Lineus longissimus]|uniref:CDC42 small effector protein 2-like n=1 Tax=Lineus longissimus TaxID=88925 RepID=UPI00315CE592